MCDLLLVLVHPLPGDNELDAPVRADVGEAGLRLQIGVLLRMRTVDALDADISLGEAIRHIAASQAVGDEQVRLPVTLFVGKVAEGVGMERLRVGGQRLLRIGDDRQRLEFDVKQTGRDLSLRRRLGHNQGNLVAFPAHDLGLGRAAQPAQHRLVRHHQPVFVDRHVGRGQYRDNAIGGLSARRVQAQDACVGHAREDDLEPGLVGQVDIAGIGGLAGHLLGGVKTG